MLDIRFIRENPGARAREHPQEVSGQEAPPRG